MIDLDSWPAAERPCVPGPVPGLPPPPPDDSIERLVEDALRLEWRSGFDGGLNSVSATEGYYDDPEQARHDAKAALLAAIAGLEQEVLAL